MPVQEVDAAFDSEITSGGTGSNERVGQCLANRERDKKAE